MAKTPKPPKPPKPTAQENKKKIIDKARRYSK